MDREYSKILFISIAKDAGDPPNHQLIGDLEATNTNMLVSRGSTLHHFNHQLVLAINHSIVNHAHPSEPKPNLQVKSTRQNSASTLDRERNAHLVLMY
jgi:hypothetical protein